MRNLKMLLGSVHNAHSEVGRYLVDIYIVYLCLELATKDEEITIRIAALFGLYTFYTTQPRISTPSVHIVNDIPISIGMGKISG